MTQKEINKIIEAHQHWIKRDVEGWENMRANFSFQDLRNVDLSGENLACADLSYADLRKANLTEANLNGATLYEADLDGAILDRTTLFRADLRRTKNIPYIPMVCPEEGSFIGFKKAMCEGVGYIVKLEIPSDARRSSDAGRKCRCDKAKVLEIQNLDGSKADTDVVYSCYDYSFQYRVNEIVKEPNFDENRWNECSKGIHFFINRQEAVDYQIFLYNQKHVIIKI